jgi:hypothetical protein
MQVPDFTQKLVGFREWRTDDDLLLKSTNSGLGAPPWSPGVQQARCLDSHRGSDFHVPCLPVVQEDCACGFYLLNRLEDVGGYGSYESVYGIVAAWGRVAVHYEDCGFRSQFCEIIGVVDRSDKGMDPETRLHHRAVAKIYGVPFVPENRVYSYVEEFGGIIPTNIGPIEPINDWYRASMSKGNILRMIEDELFQTELERIDFGVYDSSALCNPYVIGDILDYLMPATPPHPYAFTEVPMYVNFRRALSPRGVIAWLPSGD